LAASLVAIQSRPSSKPAKKGARGQSICLSTRYVRHGTTGRRAILPWPVNADVARICHSPDNGEAQHVSADSSSLARWTKGRRARTVFQIGQAVGGHQLVSVFASLQTITRRLRYRDVRQTLRYLCRRHAALHVLLVRKHQQECLLERLRKRPRALAGVTCG
jgi:hypothetical protein